MTKRQYQNRDRLLDRIFAAAPGVTFATVDALLKAERTLHRWAEGECGDASGWAIERDEATGKPFRSRYSDRQPMKRLTFPIRDMERGALARVAAIAKTFGLHYYHQTDPRGCALYVAREPLTDTNYSSIGVAVCI